MPRSDRRGFDVETRLVLLEGDATRIEEVLARMTDEGVTFHQEVVEWRQVSDEKQTRILYALLGLMTAVIVSLVGIIATAAVMAH
jgi:hypothetical protein